MRPTAAAAVLVGAMLALHGCGGAPVTAAAEKDEPVRRAAFRSLAARDFLASCPGGAARAETAREAERLDELKQLAARNGAGHAVWLGENDWNGVARHDRREPCEPGEEAYGEALAAFGGTLDALARRIAEHGR